MDFDKEFLSTIITAIIIIFSPVIIIVAMIFSSLIITFFLYAVFTFFVTCCGYTDVYSDV